MLCKPLAVAQAGRRGCCAQPSKPTPPPPRPPPQGYGKVLLPMQAKVYSEQDTSAKHGVTLRSVDYLLMRHGITGEVRVMQTQYTK